MASKLAIAAAIVAGLATGSAQAHEVKPGSGQALEDRFGRMEQMMREVPQLHGDRRRHLLDEHMHLMLEQMNAMHGLQGGHGGYMMGPGMGSGMGPGMSRRGGGAQSGPGADGDDLRLQMGAVQRRMDMMQRMMEQMLQQQQQMLGDGNGD